MAQIKLFKKLLITILTSSLAHFAALDLARAQDADQLYQQCIEDEDVARQACTTSSTTAGLDPAQQQQMAYQQSVMMQQAQMMPNSPATGQMAQQAKIMGVMSGAQAAIAGLKAAGCGKTQSGCQDVCKRAADALIQRANGPDGQRYVAQARVASQKANQCQAYKANMGEAIAQMMSMLANMLQNMQMAKQLSTAAKAGSTPLNCNDPNVAKTNVQCICQTDPKNPLCGSGVQQGIAAQMTTSPTGAITPSGPAGLGEDFPGEGTLVEGELPQADQQKGTNAGGGGGGGGGPSGGGGGAAGPLDNESGYAPSGINPTVITGQSGGSGGGLGGGGSSGSGDGAGGRGGGGDSSGMSFDLSKFLPNKKDFGNRGLAGMSVTAKDGITGPMGPSIWEKVSNQYQMQKPKLIQEK